MDRQQAQNIIKDTFESPFDKGRFIGFIKNLLNSIEDAPFSYKGNLIPDAYEQYISSLERIGKYSYAEHKIDILVVKLKKKTSIERARTMQRNFIAWYLNGSRGGEMKDAAIVAFVSPDEEDWRFSLVKMDYRFEEGKGGRVKIKEEFTPARRWSFLVGKNEKSFTAQSRLIGILEDDEHNPTLAELEEAFNIEKVTKEFFEKYRDLFLRTKETLEEVVTGDANIKADFESKGVNTVDFAKKLLGQIVFLYFLQKKGWFGVARDAVWGTGTKHFLRELFEGRHGKYNNFFNDILEPLFYEALRIDRSHDDGYYSRFNCKIPFLNGGLFDPINGYDWVKTDILLPNELFSNTYKSKEGDTGNGILDIFDRYNFTVKEDEPLEKEVAVDPEMLGKVFENLLEVKDRKSKGTYYTPREIVHYMCQQSLINYLHTAFNEDMVSVTADTFPSSVIPACRESFLKKDAGQAGMTEKSEEGESNKIITHEDIETLIKYGEQVGENEATAIIKAQKITEGKQQSTKIKHLLPESIRQNAKPIDEKLANIKVCDPAIGSGAFPVGMMAEIIKTRNVLSAFIKDQDRTIYDFKRQCIEHSLYGVDIDPGAVEIAKLRLWLSLVVDEDDIKQIKPLPNLDYKIVCGNSLLGVEKNLFNDVLFKELERIKPLLFNETIPKKKQEYKNQIDDLISKITNGHKEFDFEVYFSEVFHEKKGFDVVIANPPYVDSETMTKTNPQFRDLLKALYKSAKGNWDLFVIFIEKGLLLTQNNGSFSYIVPNKLIGAKYTETLREILLTRQFIEIRDYSDVNVFKEADVYPIVFVIQNARPSADVIMTKMSDVSSTKSTNKIANDIYYKDIYWDRYFEETSVVNLILKVSKNDKLSKYFPNVLGAATVNEAYQFKEVLLELDPTRKEYKKFINTGTIDKYCSFWGNGKTQYIKKSYYKPVVLESDIKSINPSRLLQANSCKVIIAGMAKEIEAFYDEGEYLAGKSTSIILGESEMLKILTAILNSKLISFWFAYFYHSLAMAGGYFNIGNNEINNIPIVNFSQTANIGFAKLVNQILTAKKKNPNADTSALERRIDKMVYALYGLTPEEIEIVEGK